MELLYDDEDKIKVKEYRNIDIDAIKDFFIGYERVYSVIKELTNNVEDILSFLNNEFPLYNIKGFYRLNLHNNFYFSSLSYYYGKVHGEKRGFIESKDVNPLLSAILKLIATVENIIMSLLEEVFFLENGNRDLLLFFEATPSDLDEIQCRYEALKIRDILKLHSYCYYPIIRFGTNVNIFKSTCNQYKASIIHFAGHGENYSGSLCLLGNDGKHEVLKCDTFENFFVQKYKWSADNIKLLYLNSCYSYSFVKSIFSNIRKVFESIISYMDGNDDAIALEFSSKFYGLHCDNLSIPLYVVYDETIKAVSQIDEKHNKYCDSVMWNILP